MYRSWSARKSLPQVAPRQRDDLILATTFRSPMSCGQLDMELAPLQKSDASSQPWDHTAAYPQNRG
jgi:hypothetical protein